jgi:hypothetical protein
MEGRLVNALARRQVDVYADEVEELERAHAEAGGTHRGVDASHRGPSGEQADGLQVEGAREAVDDEARSVLRHHRGAAERVRHGHGLLHERRRGVNAGDDLYERHERRGVEEVYADHSLGLAAGGGDGRNREGGRVGGQLG